MNLVKLSASDVSLEPPEEDLRGRILLDSGGKELGDIEEVYVDTNEDKIRFVEVRTGGILGLGKKPCLIPVEAAEEVTPGSVKVSHSEEVIIGSPEFDPDGDILPELLRAVYEHYGYSPPFSLERQQQPEI